MAETGAALEARLAAIMSADALGAWFEREIRHFGLTHYALGPLPEPHKDTALYLSNWPAAWIERYAMNGYASEDIAVEQARRSPFPVTWNELKALYPGAAKRIIAAAADFGWHDGFMVPVHGPDGERGIVSMVGARLRFNTEADRKTAVTIALRTYRRAVALYANRVKLPVLTGRERDALVLVARGKDDREIGAALGVTQTSAHAYVERAKKRLGATTRAQAVALAVGNDLIRP